jgi:glycosyltransferase involved in cell wall biosynthesis
VNEKNYLLIKHCFEPSFGGPAEDIEIYLIMNRVRKLTVISHPLNLKSYPYSEIREWSYGRQTRFEKVLRNRGSVMSFLYDLYLFELKCTYDVTIGFNSFAVLMGYLKTRNLRSKYINWFVDFVPSFGKSKFPKLILERLSSKLCSIWVENTNEAREARSSRNKLSSLLEHLVIPISVWGNQILPQSQVAVQNKVAFFGTLDERNGVEILSEIISKCSKANFDLEFHIIGKGPNMRVLENIKLDNLRTKLVLYGALSNIDAVIAILNECSIALAPYKNLPDTFTKFANPGKIIRYLSCGCNVIMSNVPPNHKILELQAGAVVLESDATADCWVEKIDYLLKNKSLTHSNIVRGLEFSKEFNIEIFLDDFFKRL